MWGYFYLQRAAARMWVLMGMALRVGLLSTQADTHIYGGAVGTNQNDKLLFPNGSLFEATQTNYSFPQILRTNGLNKSYYRGELLTFSALPQTQINGGPIPTAAALGAELAIQVVSVTGPPGGSFAFWEGDGEDDLGVITFSVPVGTVNGSNYFIISENKGVPGTDPYGHYHGREFTTTVEGTYIVGVRVIDISTNGVGGGPIHAPSDILSLRFHAGLWIESLQTLTNRVALSFRSLNGITNVLEASDAPGWGNWQIVAGPLRGNSAVQSLNETNAPPGSRFYRLRVLNNLP